VGAIQVGPRLLVHGQPLRLKPQRARRTAVALERGGDALTLIVVDAPIDANDLAARLAEGGFESAILLDGGPSTQLALDVGNTHLDLPGGYAVPDLLLIVGRPRR
jgi:exopolysaccharide biosynthesis protein